MKNKMRALDIAAMKENDMELIAAATGSPFNQEVHKAKLSEGFKLPAIKVYDRKSDPQDHLAHFNDLMELHLVSELTKCRVFVVTLTGFHPHRVDHQLPTTEYFIPPIFPSDQEDSHPFGTLWQCEPEEGRNLEVLHQPF